MNRYIYDALYGQIDFDYDPMIWDVISCPELQRLREVRLCNINSLCLTGAANINRFEHSIGTCYLAQECLKSWEQLLNPITKKEARLFLLAALLHDAANAAFGHSLEYIESSKGFNPELDFEYALLGGNSKSYQYRQATYENFYFDMGRELASKLHQKDFKEIGRMVSGGGRLGPLISGLIDLDNIDNVFRMAYHVGIVNSGEVALELARTMWVNENGLVVAKKSKPLLEEWQRIRSNLYKLLLLNPEEFSGKAMLSDAISYAKEKEKRENQSLLNWYDVDYELLKKIYSAKIVRIGVKEYLFKVSSAIFEHHEPLKLSNELVESFKQKGISIGVRPEIFKEEANDEWVIISRRNRYSIEKQEDGYSVYSVISRDFDAADTIMRLMKGNLYGCISIFSTDDLEKYNFFTVFSKRLEIEQKINIALKKKFNNVGKLKSAMVSIHPILDKNKTDRQLNISFEDGTTEVIGKSSSQLLLGVFFRNSDLNMYKITKVQPNLLQEVRNFIRDLLKEIIASHNIQEVELYAEVTKLKPHK